MPNHRDPTLTPARIETAHPWPAHRWADAETQEHRGRPGARGIGAPVEPHEQHARPDASGVRPLPPILPSMPRLKTGDQGG